MKKNETRLVGAGNALEAAKVKIIPLMRMEQ
jgi:hypothetical protein